MRIYKTLFEKNVDFLGFKGVINIDFPVFRVRILDCDCLGPRFRVVIFEIRGSGLRIFWKYQDPDYDFSESWIWIWIVISLVNWTRIAILKTQLETLV